MIYFAVLIGLLIISELTEFILTDDLKFARRYCYSPMACCYGPQNCTGIECNFQFAYETLNDPERSLNSIQMQLTVKKLKFELEIAFYSICFVLDTDYLAGNLENGDCIDFYFGGSLNKKIPIYVETLMKGIKSDYKIHAFVDGIRFHESNTFLQVTWLTKLKFENKERHVDFFKNNYHLILKNGRGILDGKAKLISSDEVKIRDCEIVLKYRSNQVQLLIEFYKIFLYCLMISIYMNHTSTKL